MSTTPGVAHSASVPLPWLKLPAMSRLRWVVFIVIVTGSALLLFRYTFMKERPPIPADEVHLTVAGNGDACVSCHGPGGGQPRPRSHPNGKDCTRCHRWEGERP